MRPLTAVHYIAATTAAGLCFWFGALSALPRYPNNIPWPHWVSVASAVGTLATYMVWFHLASWIISRGSQLQSMPLRLLVYVLSFVGVAAVLFAPLLPAYGIFGLCALGLDCGERMQGAFNVLHASAFQLKFYVAVPICVLFVSVTISLSRRSHVRKGKA